MHDDHYNELYDLKMKLVKELAEYGKTDLKTTSNLNIVDTLAHAAKNVCKIMESMDEEEYGYSNRMMPPIYRNSYEGRDWDRSYENRGRGSNARRDSIGRYSSDDGMLDELYATMNAAKDETTRNNIQRMINKMEGR